MDEENQNEQENEGQLATQEDQSAQQSSGRSAASNIKRVKNVQKKAVESASKKAISKSAMMALSHVLFYVIIFLIAMVVLIGIAMFFVTMPGMIMEKLKTLGRAIGNAWASWFGSDDAELAIERKQIYEVMDYVEQMGYGLKEHGYLTHYLDRGDAVSTKKVEYNGKDITHEDVETSEEQVDYDEEQGVFRSSDTGLIVAGCSDFIMQYIISDNYMYTIRNFNVVTNNWWEAVFEHIKGIFSDDMTNRRGMILLLHDNGSVGSVNTTWGSEDTYDAGERGYIKIDPDSRKMQIKKGWISAVEIEYDLDGWTGRYGMPLEFLLSVHSATMMPDLAYDMATSFDTQVRILLHKSENNSIIANYKGSTGYVSEDQVKEVTNSHIFDTLSFSKGEAGELINKGIVPPGHNPPECGCTTSRTFEYNGETYTVEHGDYKEYPYDNMGNPLPPIEHTDEDYYLGLDSLGNLAYLPLPEGVEIVEDTSKLTAGDNCYNYVKTVISLMNKQTVDDFDTYSPYIESVRDHWYRDVYFVVPEGSGLRFVKYDYEYENLMKERWTEYEVWGDDDDTDTLPSEELRGRYKLYKVTIDENGNYNESSSPETNVDAYKAYEEARNQGDDITKYVKKAKTLNIANEYEDLYWNKVDNVYSAYDPKGDQESTMTPMYKDSAINDESDAVKKEAMKKIYAELTMNVVKQTGDGLRTVTNNKIKKMFLSNKYFRYDGTKERAEEITQLRETYNIDYGALSDSDLDKKIKYTNEDGKSQDVTVKDVSGTVQITQDSINSFSMLENTHTLDADFIYRDFKELIVELGFFTKEELTEAIPRIMQFPVAEIGTYGYPIRTLDKREQEKGTLIHSEKDYKAYTSAEMDIIKDATGRGEGEVTDTDAQQQGMLTPFYTEEELELGKKRAEEYVEAMKYAATTKTGRSDKEKISSSGDQEENDLITKFAYKAEKKNKSMVQPGPGGPFKGETLVETATNCWKYIVEHGSEYSYAGASIPCDKGRTVDCSAYVSWVLYEYGYEDFEGGQVCSEGFLNTNWNEKYGWEEFEVASGQRPTEPLQPGDLLVRHGEGTHHITFIVEVEGNNTKTMNFDCGSENNWRCAEAQGGNPVDKSYFLTKIGQGKVIRLEDAPKKIDEPYEGYKGNEAVVSPVTGILLEYGRYDDNSKNIVKKQTTEGEVENVVEELRENIDMKYPVTSSLVEGEIDDSNEKVSSQKTTDVEEKEPVIDKVGYAKILVLEGKQLEKLVSGSGTGWSINQLVDYGSSSGKYNYHETLLQKPEDMKPWDEKQTTVYGFKEFAENYYDYGVAGFTVYIDGFVCELPEEVEVPEDVDPKDADKDNYKKLFHGEELTFDDFKNQTFGSLKDQSGSTSKIKSKYEPDEPHQFASKSVTERVSAENETKKSAASVVSNNGLVFIKEGTVLGRTMSDMEANSAEINGHPNRKNNDPSHDFKYYRPKYEEDDADKDTDKEKEPTVVWKDDEFEYKGDRIIGNYLRVILLDENYEVVENVEDYMKLDELTKPEPEGYPMDLFKSQIDRTTWVNLVYAYTKDKDCTDPPFKNKEDLGKFYDICVEKGVNPDFALTRAVSESSLKSPNGNFWGLGTPNGSSLKSYGSWDFTLGKFCDAILEFTDPSSWKYGQIEQYYKDRKAVTENGGVPEWGYGHPDEIPGIMSLYSWLGDDHSADSAGSGGQYYLNPSRAGVNIYLSQEQYETLCRGPHGLSGPTTVWEQGSYTAYQCRQMLVIAHRIWPSYYPRDDYGENKHAF